MRYPRLAAAVLMTLATACTAPVKQTSKQAVVLKKQISPLEVMPPVPRLRSGTGSLAVARSNKDIARDFLDLSFALESGAALSVFSRFEEPVSIALANPAPKHLQRDLSALIARLRSEAGIDITQRPTGSGANIVVETLPKHVMQRVVPSAACFVIPNVSSWNEFRSTRFRREFDWSGISRRKHVAVFMPNDVSAQEARDCLHEEIAQALGPLNDLYRLPDSIFNDDNIHLVLTPFDMLTLRSYYDPALKSGMSKKQVAALLPGILDRLNPAGRRLASRPLRKTPQSWTKAIETALGPRTSFSRRLSAADRGLGIATSSGLNDHRLGFSHLAVARVNMKNHPKKAATHFALAYDILKSRGRTTDIHTAHAAVQMASLSLSAGRVDTALSYLNSSIPTARKARNATLLFSLLSIKAEALDLLGQSQAARISRAEAQTWAQYGIGSSDEIVKRRRKIAALAAVYQNRVTRAATQVPCTNGTSCFDEQVVSLVKQAQGGAVSAQ